jgi:thiamine biosynthesis protein ThiS
MKNIFMLNNRIEDWKPGLSVKDVLDFKNYSFKLLVVKINGKLIKKTDYENTEIPPGADVQIIHLMSGG